MPTFKTEALRFVSIVQLVNPLTCKILIKLLPGKRTIICDRACENQSYLHVKFDLILSISNLITLSGIPFSRKIDRLFLRPPPLL